MITDDHVLQALLGELAQRQATIPSRPQAFLAALRDVLVSGGVRPGDTLPPEQVLAQAAGIGEKSVRAALSALRREGLVRTIHGKGTIVLDTGVIYRDSRTRLTEEARRSIPPDKGTWWWDCNQAGYYSDVQVTVRVERPTPYDVETLRILPDQEILVRDQVLLAGFDEDDLEPFQTSELRFVNGLVPVGSVLRRNPPASVEEFRELERAGMQLDSTEDYSAETATEELAARLGVEPGAALLRSTRLVFDRRNSQPVMVALNYMTHRVIIRQEAPITAVSP